MGARGWGRVVTIGSVQQVRPHPQMMVYAGTKAAQLNWSWNLARQFGGQGVTVNNLAPGAILTARNRAQMATEGEALVQRIPAGRLGKTRRSRRSGLAAVFGCRRVHQRDQSLRRWWPGYRGIKHYCAGRLPPASEARYLVGLVTLCEKSHRISAAYFGFPGRGNEGKWPCRLSAGLFSLLAQPFCSGHSLQTPARAEPVFTQKINAYVECINRLSERSYDFRGRAISAGWKEGPTGKERIIYGPTRFTTRPAARRASKRQTPSTAPSRADMPRRPM